MQRRRFIAAAGGAGLAAMVPAAAAARDLETLHCEALELVVSELKKTPPSGREGLLKLLDLLVSAAACRSPR